MEKEFELPCAYISEEVYQIETDVLHIEVQELRKSEIPDDDIYEIRGRIYIPLGAEEDTWSNFYTFLDRKTHFLVMKPVFNVSIQKDTKFYILSAGFMTHLTAPRRRTLYVENVKNIEGLNI